jgi:hypothetical protein
MNQDSPPNIPTIPTLTNRRTVVKMSYSSEVELQLAIPAIRWLYGLREHPFDRSKEGPHEVRLQVSNALVARFIDPYMMDSGYNVPLLNIDGSWNVLEFPVERNFHLPTCIRTLFGDPGLDFFMRGYWPLTQLGNYLKKLHGRQPDHANKRGVFLLPFCVDGSLDSDVDEDLWTTILRRLGDDQDIPLETYSCFVPGSLRRRFPIYSYVNPVASMYDVWDWIKTILHCQMYIGTNCFFSQLAGYLGIPRIIIWKKSLEYTDNPQITHTINFFPGEKPITSDEVLRGYDQLIWQFNIVS